MNMRKGRPFLEILSSSLRGDYKFPILEFLTFLFLLSSFVFASFGGFGSTEASEEYFVFHMANSLTGLPLFILVMLLLRNVASGIGNDLEKGTIQTILAYPLKRRSILTARLISAFVVAVALFLVIQISALFILANEMVARNLTVVFLSYAANISTALFTASITLLMTLLLRRGSLGIVVGIMFYFMFGILASLVSFVAQAMNSVLPLQIYSVISPIMGIHFYYGSMEFEHSFWSPSFSEAMVYLGGAYAITASLLLLSYFYFCRRLNL
jgi:ABC-type transport system involved in multi-copper enzyme maturation permease subunit